MKKPTNSLKIAIFTSPGKNWQILANSSHLLALFRPNKSKMPYPPPHKKTSDTCFTSLLVFIDCMLSLVLLRAMFALYLAFP